ncbi:hypothetical protein LSH36_1381g00002 [Paralvinella palmiformis]|uniref:Death domain-containing protein n=1 Tax=Paralvinella palmiformis TaxID=53620 RepID=A0AAD9ITD1_9ANNE|nr:hypothetical protein LSH36_1381g00002 [Paralvinella palmiformis]
MSLAGEDAVILSLDEVTCSIIFLNVPRKGDWRKQKQIYYHKDNNDETYDDDDDNGDDDDHHHVGSGGDDDDGCGDSRRRKIEVHHCLDLLFTELTAIIVFNESVQKAKDMYAYSLRRCKEWFDHVITKCVDVESHPPSFIRLRGSRQVLLSLTRNHFTLCTKTEPHTCIISWPLEYVIPKLDGEIFQVDVEGNGTYRFTSRMDKSWIKEINRSMRDFLHLDHTYLEPTPRSPEKRTPLKPEQVYLDIIDEPVCEKCKMLYLTYLSTTEVTEEKPCYNLDLNEYVMMRRSLYKRVVSVSKDVDHLTYLTTTDAKNVSEADERIGNLATSDVKTVSEADKRISNLATSDAKTVSEADKHISNLTTSDVKTVTEADERISNLTTSDAKTVSEADEHISNLTTADVKTVSEADKHISNLTTSDGKTYTKRYDPETQSIIDKVTPDDKCHRSVTLRQKAVQNQYLLDYSTPRNSDAEKQSAESTSRQEPKDALAELTQTLQDVLHNKGVAKDTLQLSRMVRSQLCIKLYLPSAKTVGTCMEDWQLFGDIIGLTAEAINLVSIIVKNHSLPYPAAELLLRHWQYVYNTYGKTDSDGPCPYACNKDNLIKILDTMERLDLVKLIENGENQQP